MRIRKRVLSALWLVLALLALPSWGQEERVRIGVFQFESKTSGVTQQQANAVMDLMTRALASSKSISVIERAQLDKVGKEIRLGQSGLVDASTAAEVGRIAGVQYIYMKNFFVSKFVKSDKKTMVFSDINKKKTQIPYLYNSISDPLRYYSGLKYEMAEKNLDAGYSIVFVKPENSLNDILNREAMKDIMTKLNGNNSGSYKMTNVKIPYIDTQSKIDMKKVLSNIGFEGIFDPAVSEYKVFKNIRNLKVSDILQEARFKMNESGIEAAAYTEIGMVKTALPEEAKKQLDFDKPFMYFVKDDGGNIYFVGTYVNYEGK